MVSFPVHDIQLYKHFDMIRRYIVNDVMKVADTGIQLFMQSHQRYLFSIRSTAFYVQQISLLIYKQTFLDPSVAHWDDTDSYVLYLQNYNAESSHSCGFDLRFGKKEETSVLACMTSLHT
ncbi:hypothetical protein EJB10_03360 [Wolbachia endosymbiont of Brugia malayi]|uniref:hypothetical protein n=1 Tax=Wolbachia endosymbiont of Brugia malayi TaxID=80849 RepID=UPI00004C92F6|nr:hypothetical protein [Wolbachia endosymbiont of Brugia malayi]AAW70821.1 Predicted protein [Wolbachia endosymbiont strain TRS of Brugia malayi]QCB61787.1 hypothetical protein EJB10_03360 [Wolbachia endosymbiont of Brugia malayi]